MPSASTTILDPILDAGGTLAPPPLRGGAPPAPSRVAMAQPPVSNARLAMLALITFESMLFAGLLGGYVVLRWSSIVWPPAGQPFLPIGVSWLNSAVLLGSSLPLLAAKRALKRGEDRAVVRSLALAASLGAIFLLIQGFEWVRLVAHGMTVAGGTYGGSFVILIGTHGLHVAAAVVWLAIVAIAAAAGRLTAGRSAALDICSMYWHFVCALWVVLFSLVYLA